jgi:uncharacterized protein YijF (DUF1287 family)
MRFFLSFLFALCTLSFSTAAIANASLVSAAQDRTKKFVTYDGSYIRLDYPGGDVPAYMGVCTDVIIRSYRAAFGFDFQKAVHEDMRANFDAYPANWGLTRPGTNIDHRRVPNLEAFLTRQGASLGKSDKVDNFKPGDLVTWRIDGRLPHIGIVTNRKAADGTPLIVHNIGMGPVEDNILFAYPMTGHFRFIPEN